jgi:hypothetical protein
MVEALEMAFVASVEMGLLELLHGFSLFAIICMAVDRTLYDYLVVCVTTWLIMNGVLI